MNSQLCLRRAKRGDLAAIVALVRESTDSSLQVGEVEVMEWLLTKGLWLALRNDSLVGVAGWHAENLVSITDVFCVSPTSLLPEVGGQLLETIEDEARSLICEANIVLATAWASKAACAFVRQQGYESRQLEDLHRNWQEVLNDCVAGEPDLLVKQLRDRMVAAPL